METAYVLVKSVIAHEMEIMNELLKLDLVKEAKLMQTLEKKLSLLLQNRLEKLNTYYLQQLFQLFPNKIKEG